MKIRVFKEVTIDADVDVDIDDVLLERGAAVGCRMDREEAEKQNPTGRGLHILSCLREEEMTRDEPYIIECPYCHMEFRVLSGDDLCNADDAADDTTTECRACGKRYVLVARHEVWFTARAVSDKPGE